MRKFDKKCDKDIAYIDNTTVGHFHWLLVKKILKNLVYVCNDHSTTNTVRYYYVPLPSTASRGFSAAPDIFFCFSFRNRGRHVLKVECRTVTQECNNY